jgi:hypothetical protein
LCDDFSVAKFSVYSALSGLFFPPSGPAFLLPVRHVSKCKIAVFCLSVLPQQVRLSCPAGQRKQIINALLKLFPNY